MHLIADDTCLITLCAALGGAMDAHDRICSEVDQGPPGGAWDRKRERACQQMAKLARKVARLQATSDAAVRAKAAVAYRLAGGALDLDFEGEDLDLGVVVALSLAADLAGDTNTKLAAAGFFVSPVKPHRGGRRKATAQAGVPAAA